MSERSPIDVFLIANVNSSAWRDTDGRGKFKKQKKTREVEDPVAQNSFCTFCKSVCVRHNERDQERPRFTQFPVWEVSI